ncbi:MAG: 5'/3'-nucleotidase SurE [Erysipelotrichaceae bacterium]|nr:5'/3'-nucleotidase SurE [Erysipelotrichaceae bacterium]
MRVLLCNDDGIDFKGLHILVQAFSEIADVYVAAPESQRSSYSHHLTIKGKVRYEERNFPYAKKAYALWGSPADCVHLGLNYLFGKDMDLIVSGINNGANVSTDIIYSGTIGAAREAYIYGYPAMAVSLDGFEEKHFETAGAYAVKIALEYLKDENRNSYFINLNVPDLEYKDIQGIKVCDRIGRVAYHDEFYHELIQDKDYIVIKENGSTFLGDENDLRIDRSALLNGYVSLSPLGNGHIDESFMEAVEEIAQKCR